MIDRNDLMLVRVVEDAQPERHQMTSLVQAIQK